MRASPARRLPGTWPGALAGRQWAGARGMTPCNPDAARAESADRRGGSFSLWEQAWTRSSAVCTVYENGSPAGEEPPNAKFVVLHARCSHYDGCWTLERSPNVSVSERIYVMAHRTCQWSELHLENHVEGRYLSNQGGFEGRSCQRYAIFGW